MSKALSSSAARRSTRALTVAAFHRGVFRSWARLGRRLTGRSTMLASSVMVVARDSTEAVTGGLPVHIAPRILGNKALRGGHQTYGYSRSRGDTTNP
ncbi:hypothetical protein ACOZ38_24075 [Sphaerisporangium viridialbum]|uniref:hypothetical protein n=1 Tax=Sphaerisporangium viridialbum TaxID=46189 RepID=UPI003C706FC5